MADKDTILKDGQEVSTPYRGPRASNTLETLRPREVNAAAGHFCDGLKYTVSWPRELCSNCPPIPKTDSAPLQGRGLPPEQYNLLPVDWPTAAETMGFQEVERAYGVLQLPLEERVTRLEEQVDSILDRLAKHNQRSGHKI